MAPRCAVRYCAVSFDLYSSDDDTLNDCVVDIEYSANTTLADSPFHIEDSEAKTIVQQV